MDDKDQDQSQSTSNTTFSDLSIPEDDSLTASSSMSSFSNTSNQNGAVQHGGFVPGYDPWAAKSDKLGGTGLDIQSQRRKSESVLHDLSATNLEYLSQKSIYRTSDSLNAPSGPSIPPHFSGRSISPTNGGLSGSLTGSRAFIMRPGSLSYEQHPLSGVESRDSGVTGADTRAPGHHLNSTQPALHPHFETTHPSETGLTHHHNDGSTMDVNSDDLSDGYPLNRHYNQTFPIYGAAHATALLHSSSLHLDNAPPVNSSIPSVSAPTTNLGTYASMPGPVDRFVQNMANVGHQKPPPGFFPHQGSMLGGPNSQRQHHAHRQGLNQYAPNFQPASMSTAQQHPDSGNMAAMGRPGMISPLTGVWREGGSGVSDFIQQEYAYQQQPPMPPQYLQQRRGSQQQTMHPPAVSNAHQGYPFYGHTIGKVSGPGVAPNAPSGILSFPILPDLPPAVAPTRPRTEVILWAVVRVTNIPWDVSLQDMLGFFAGFPYPPEHLLAQNVHILMDRASGKTFNSAFVELALTARQAGMVAQARNQRVLKGRQVSVELSSQDELLRTVFPKWTGNFVNGEPSISGEKDTIESASGDGDRDGQHIGAWNLDSTRHQAQSTPPFVTRDEINALLVICRNYKLHFSRKCAERPFENILSILAKYPWHQSHRVLPLHRDHIFELLKLSIESLRMHLSKEHNTIHPTLLMRMVRCAVLTPAFTERQKNMVLVVAGVACPEDIVGWMAPPAPVEVAQNTLDASAERNVVTEATEQEPLIPSDSSTPLNKVEESSEVKAIEESIEGLSISEKPVEPKDENPSPTITWAAVATPSAKSSGNIETPSNESTPTATPAAPSTNASLKSGGRSLALAPSYAAAVVQSVGGDVTPKASAHVFHHPGGNLALGSNESGSPSSPTSLGSLLAHPSSNAWKSLGSHYRHNSGRSLSISGISSFASPNTQLMPAGTIPYAFPSLTPASVAESPVSSFRSAFLKNSEQCKSSDDFGFGSQHAALTTSARHYRSGSLPKLAISQTAGQTTCSSAATSSVSSLVTTPFNISPVSTSPLTSGEKSTSESILNAIKTITQSTPRLTKSGSVNQMNGINSTVGQTSGSISGLGLGHKQQRREGGETL
ncbi:hypothetical protein BGX29_002011 [Mortierella sp. GBA35]|nr:hypothetical protein BGX29_002011 [Mortierella sp. GBA35]